MVHPHLAFAQTEINVLFSWKLVLTDVVMPYKITQNTKIFKLVFSKISETKLKIAAFPFYWICGFLAVKLAVASHSFVSLRAGQHFDRKISISHSIFKFCP